MGIFDFARPSSCDNLEEDYPFLSVIFFRRGGISRQFCSKKSLLWDFERSFGLERLSRLDNFSNYFSLY